MSEIESLERPSQEPYKRRLLKGSPFCSDCGNMIPTNCPVCGLDLENEKVIAEGDKRAFCSVACVLTEHPELRRCLRVEMIL